MKKWGKDISWNISGYDYLFVIYSFISIKSIKDLMNIHTAWFKGSLITKTSRDGSCMLGTFCITKIIKILFCEFVWSSFSSKEALFSFLKIL